MPLMGGSSRAVIAHNIHEMVAAGHPHAQAVAAALHNANYRPHMDSGGYTFPTRSPTRERAAEVFSRGRGQSPQTDLNITPMNEYGAPGGPIDTQPGLDWLPQHMVPDTTRIVPTHVPGYNKTAAGGLIRRDDGGIIPTQPTPGLQPSVSNQAPYMQNYLQRFAQMTPEQLQELTVRLGPNSPLSALAQRVLAQKQITPQTQQAAATAQQNGQQMMQPQAQVGMQPAQPQYARGGMSPKDDGKVPILAAGGEFVVSPHHVARYGDGDVKQGHKRLDEYVIRKRQEIIKKMSSLKPPVGSSKR